MYNFGTRGFRFDELAKVMYFHLRRMKVPVKFRIGTKSEAVHRSFIVDLITECENYVMENPVRLRMPMDLGYMQVLKFDYRGSNPKHLNTYYGKDFVVAWVVHHMYKHVTLFNCDKLKIRLFEHIKKTGMKDYLEDLMPGDFFYLIENKHVNSNGLGRFCEREDHYTRKIPKKTLGMQRKETEWKLFLP